MHPALRAILPLVFALAGLACGDGGRAPAPDASNPGDSRGDASEDPGATSPSEDGGAPVVDAGAVETGEGAAAPDAGPGDSGEGGPAQRNACPAGPWPAPVGSNRQNVCAGFAYNHNFNEGPVWIASQNAFFFSNFENGTAAATASNFDGDVIKYTPGGQCEVFIKDVGTNGLAVAPDGNLLATSHLTRTITEFDLVTKQPRIIADNYMGLKLNSPNDIIVHSNGTIYFSNPTYQLGNRTQEMPASVVRIDPAGALSLVAMGGAPNGVTLSPDQARLYVEQDGSGVKVYDLDANGVPTAGPRDFSGQTDGMSVDCAGNVYLSGSGGIIGPDGTQVGTIPGGGGTMPTFGGVDGKTLFVVGSGTLAATVQMNLPGLP